LISTPKNRDAAVFDPFMGIRIVCSKDSFKFVGVIRKRLTKIVLTHSLKITILLTTP